VAFARGIWLEIFAINQLLGAAIARSLNEDSAAREFALHSTLAGLGHATPTQVSALLGLPLSTASAQLNRLVARGHATRKVVRTLRTGGGSTWLAATRDVLWVSNGRSGTVTHVNARTNKRVATIRVGRGPADSGIVRGELWVPNLSDATLSRIDTRRNRVVETLPVGTGPFVVPDHASELWVASWGGGDVWKLAPSS
jgi:YVTN family beta-propeller protein